jgi:4-amino-4-deoxy-L-arabinose transferase-like glycosyltransferase
VSGLSLSETSVEEGRRGPGRRALLVLFLVALALRLGALALLAPQRVAADGDAWRAGHEAACLAQSILRGGPYGDPWGKGSGASSWLTPPYPALVAACMALLGGVTPAAWLALFALQSLVSAATALLVVRLGRALGLARAALVAGWAFALYPPSVWNASQVVWDSTLVAFGLSGFLAAFLERARRGRQARRTSGSGSARSPS